MRLAIGSAVIVLVCGYLGGCFLGEAGCIMATAAAMTGCIVYAIRTEKPDEQEERDSEVET